MKYIRHKTALVGPHAKIGENTRIWAFANIQDGAIVGRGCKICDGCFVEKGSVIGDFVTLKNGVNVFEGVTLEDDVFVGANVAFINDRYPRSHRKGAWVLEKTLVKKGAALGANATLMCGVVIGEYAVVGAGSVVIKDVAPYTVVVGNPAVSKGFVCRCGHKLIRSLKCSCGLKYSLGAQGLKLTDILSKVRDGDHHSLRKFGR